MATKISVIVPTYNRADIISETIGSVLNQTYQNFEIIVVDDGSIDNTREIIVNINDPRIKYIYQENAGPSAARNNGIKNAQGEYVAFLDSDDIWLPEKLEKQVNIINDNPDIGMVSCWAEGVSHDLKQVLYRKASKINCQKDFIRGMLFDPDNTINGTPTFVIKKEYFDKVGYFPENMKLLEDWDMWFRAALESEYCCINEVLAKFRTHSSLSTSININEAEDLYLTFLERAISNKKLSSELLRKKNSIYSNAYYKMALWGLCRSDKDISASRKCLIKSLKYNSKKLFNPIFMFTLISAFMPEKINNLYIKLRRNLKKIILEKKICG